MHISSFTVRVALAVGLASAAACGPAAPEPFTPAAVAPTSSAPTAVPAASSAPAPAPAATAAPARVAFSTLSAEQKLQRMKSVVMPSMSKVFQEGDAKKYGEFGCKTCHGDKKQDPHVVLPKLTLSGDGFAKLMATKPAVTKFMAEKVTPAMAEAMGDKPYDPATHEGFGCGGCHRVN